MQEKFAVDGADAVAGHVSGRDLEDGTVQELLRPACSLSLGSLPEKVRGSSTLLHF